MGSGQVSSDKERTTVASALRRRAPGAFILALAIMATAINIHRTAGHPPDDAPAIVAKFAALNSGLPDDASVCYGPVPRTSDGLRLFQLAQYALAPRILVPEDQSADCRWTIGPDFRVKVR
jgi:hypothetical protein